MKKIRMKPLGLAILFLLASLLPNMLLSTPTKASSSDSLKLTVGFSGGPYFDSSTMTEEDMRMWVDKNTGSLKPQLFTNLDRYGGVRYTYAKGMPLQEFIDFQAGVPISAIRNYTIRTDDGYMESNSEIDNRFLFGRVRYTLPNLYKGYTNGITADNPEWQQGIAPIETMIAFEWREEKFNASTTSPEEFENAIAKLASGETPLRSDRKFKLLFGNDVDTSIPEIKDNQTMFQAYDMYEIVAVLDGQPTVQIEDDAIEGRKLEDKGLGKNHDLSKDIIELKAGDIIDGSKIRVGVTGQTKDTDNDPDVLDAIASDFYWEKVIAKETQGFGLQVLLNSPNLERTEDGKYRVLKDMTTDDINFTVNSKVNTGKISEGEVNLSKDMKNGVLSPKTIRETLNRVVNIVTPINLKPEEPVEPVEPEKPQKPEEPEKPEIPENPVDPGEGEGGETPGEGEGGETPGEGEGGETPGEGEGGETPGEGEGGETPGEDEDTTVGNTETDGSNETGGEVETPKPGGETENTNTSDKGEENRNNGNVNNGQDDSNRETNNPSSENNGTDDETIIIKEEVDLGAQIEEKEKNTKTNTENKVEEGKNPSESPRIAEALERMRQSYRDAPIPFDEAIKNIPESNRNKSMVKINPVTSDNMEQENNAKESKEKRSGGDQALDGKGEDKSSGGGQGKKENLKKAFEVNPNGIAIPDKLEINELPQTVGIVGVALCMGLGIGYGVVRFRKNMGYDIGFHLNKV